MFDVISNQDTVEVHFYSSTPHLLETYAAFRLMDAHFPGKRPEGEAKVYSGESGYVLVQKYSETS